MAPKKSTYASTEGRIKNNPFAHFESNIRLHTSVLGDLIAEISFFSTCLLVREASETLQEEAIGLIEVASGEVKEAVRTVGQTRHHTLAVISRRHAWRHCLVVVRPRLGQVDFASDRRT